MYNAKLNAQWEEKLQRAVEGKRLLMVGNAVSMFSEEYGSMIDNEYDFVVRFGKGVPYEQFRSYLGSRTDLWFFGTARAGMRSFFKKAPFKMYTLSQINLYNEKRAELVIHRDMLDGSFQPYRDFFLAGSAKEIIECNKEINDGIVDARISQGAQCVHFFHNKIKTYKSIDLVGFDFFGQGFGYNYETGKEHIPTFQPTTSWHMPLISKGYDKNPHNQNDKEEAYIRSVPNLNVIEMPKLNMEKVEEVLRKIRGPMVKITGELQ